MPNQEALERTISTIFYGSNESCGADKTESTEMLARYLAYMGGRTNNAEERMSKTITQAALANLWKFSLIGGGELVELQFYIQENIKFAKGQEADASEV
ncbi:hypothetical protein GQ457_14G005090 [Hibiscus cannabinus]